VNRGLRRYLRSRGATDEEIDRAADEGSLTLLVLDRMLMPGARQHTLSEAAAQADLDAVTARRIWRAAGFPDLPEDAPALTDADVEALRTVSRIVSQSPMGLSIERVLRLTRVFSASLARMADVESDLTVEGVRLARETGLADEEVAEEFRRAARFDEAERLVDHLHRLQLRAATLRKLAGHELSEESPVVAVGFVDLVGYTALAEELGEEELTELVTRFGDLAFDIVIGGGGRFVKNIGDEVMYVADNVGDAADVALRLAAESHGDEVLPEARAGLAYGPVVARDGDYYGPVVNLASRLTDRARAGTVLASTDVHEVMADDPRFEFRSLRPRYLRDIGRVPLWVLRRAGRNAESGRRSRRS
jgi:adenylate cyclase